jgi:hypothetical protein
MQKERECMARNAGQAEKEVCVETRRRIVDEICYYE